MRLHLSVLCLAVVAAGCAQQPSSPMSSVSQPQPRTQVSIGQEVGAAARDRIQVTFAPGSARLTAQAAQQLDVAARLFRDVRPVRMFSIGYSDASGSEFDNLLLAARRAQAVKAGMVARGIPANQIFLRSFGESDPVDRTDPDDAVNRRVVVRWDVL